MNALSMLLKFILHFTLILSALSLTSYGQDTTAILRILDQAAHTDSSGLAKEKFEVAYNLANRINYNKGILISLKNLSHIELQEHNTTNALRYLLEELELLEEKDHARELILVNIQIGDLYSRESLNNEAIVYYKNAENRYEEIGEMATETLYEKIGYNYGELLEADSACMYYSRLLERPGKENLYRLNILRKIVNAFQRAKNYDSSLVYNLRIKALLESYPEYQDELGAIYNNLGYTYNFLKRYNSAINWFLQSEPYFRENNDQLAILYSNLGIAYFNKQDTKLAIQYLMKALSVAGSRDNLVKGKISNVLANIYLFEEDFYNAQNFNRDAVQFANMGGDTQLRSKVYETAAEIHSRLFEYEEAIYAYKTHLGLRDSLLIANQLEQERMFQEKLKLEKTEKEIRLLLIRDQIQHLTIEQLELEKQRQNLEIDNLKLAARQRENDLEILKQSEKIRESTLRNQQLETRQAKQELQLVQGRLDLQQKEQQLNELAQAEALAQSELGKKEALLIQEEQRFKLLEKEQLIQQQATTAAQRIGLLLLLISLMILGGLLYTRQTNKKLAQQKLDIEVEQEKSESLLLNILPYSVAQELKEKGKTSPRKYNSVSILFSDFVDFTRISAQRSPEQIIAELNDCFRGFDAIMEAEGIEKIQTIGDGYLAVGGLPDEAPDHAVRCIKAAKKMIAFLKKRNQYSEIKWKARIGIHSGAIMAGVVGTKKFAYNIFGDSVNTASRIETAGEQGRINISADTYELIKDYFECEYRGRISAKGKGDLEMYFVK